MYVYTNKYKYMYKQYNIIIHYICKLSYLYDIYIYIDISYIYVYYAIWWYARVNGDVPSINGINGSLTKNESGLANQYQVMEIPS